MMTKWPNLISDFKKKMTGLNWRNFTPEFCQSGPAKIKSGEIWGPAKIKSTKVYMFPLKGKIQLLYKIPRYYIY